METEITLENFEELWQSLLVKASDKYDTPPDVIKIGECTIGTLGNFSASTGKSKSKKTFNVCAIVASAVLNGKVLNYESHFPEGKRRILYFDTEQSEDYCQKIIWRINRLCGFPDTQDIDSIDFSHLRELGTLDRRTFIEMALATRHQDVGLVIIDGLRDLLFDINSSTEAAEVIGLLMRWTSQYRIHIHTVLHQNKGDDNVRGHIGTELNHKAESILQIVRSKKDGNISEVHASYTRDKEFDPFAFLVSEDAVPVLVEDYSFEPTTRVTFDYVSMSEESHRKALDKAFEDVMAPIGYNDLLEKLKVGYSVLGFGRGYVAMANLKVFLEKYGMLLKTGKKYVYNREFHYVPPPPDESYTISTEGIGEP